MKRQNFTRTRLVQLMVIALLWMVVPVAMEAQANGDGVEITEDALGTILTMQPNVSEMYIGSTVQVNVMIENAEDLYGLEVSCSVDPTVLSWQSAEFSGFFYEALVGTNQFDQTTGQWTGIISQKNPAPSLNGNGLFAQLTFEAVGVGTTSVLCEPLAANRDGFEVQMDVSGTPMSVLETPITGFISGGVAHQGRFDHSGIIVNSTGPVSSSFSTGVNGLFELAELEDGEYQITVDANGYLPTCTTVTVANGDLTLLDTTLLFGGDLDDDNEIRINDATLIGSNLGLSASSTPAMDPRADINADGQVNVQDLSILGGNFGQIGCQEWTPDTSTTAPVTSS